MRPKKCAADAVDNPNSLNSHSVVKSILLILREKPLGCTPGLVNGSFPAEVVVGKANCVIGYASALRPTLANGAKASSRSSRLPQTYPSSCVGHDT